MAANECPVSLITPESKRLVEVFERADFAHQGSGAALYGTDLSRWPARAIDALVVIQQERNREHNARAMMKETDG
ncbi:MAG: hypothetical protein IT168_33290 [Bryobacterales bacterium]|nr:hypothetical protein [Bryobacterales bacterium]